MISSLPSFEQAWQLLGWTMILFLAAGTVVFIIGSALRVILKRANPSVRYATSLATFAVLAITPLVIAGYLSASLPRQWGELANSTRQRGVVASNRTNQELNAEHAKSAAIAKHDIFVATEITEGTERIDGVNRPVVAMHGSSDFESLLNRSAAYLPWLWCVGTPLTFLLLATGLIGTERLRSSCDTLTDGPIRVACDELQKTLRIGRQVGVAVCERIATPLLVGVVKPLILLPPAALNGWTTAELEMVLIHELSHVRRWDNAVNLGQRIVESLLFFHPAVWIVSGWVRRDREDCCDAAVVRHTEKPQAYAELLLALASHTPGLAASTAMAQHPVAGRIRRILKLEDEPMLVTRKGLFIGISAIVVAALLVFALPTTDAEETVSHDSKFSREAKRVEDEREDERAGATNPTRQRGEKETTNPLASRERQRPDLTTEDTESTEEGSEKSRFPTLEEQRAADLAYKLLGVELEKLTPEELESVKAKGYQGGLKVVGPIGFTADDKIPPLWNRDLLVGLHVWPTESLKQVTEILTRDDLDQLSPLKFYILRPGRAERGRGGFGGGIGGDPGTPPGEYAVVTGRIKVDLDAWRAMQQRNSETPDPGPALEQLRVQDGSNSPLIDPGPPLPQDTGDRYTPPSLPHPDQPTDAAPTSSSLQPRLRGDEDNRSTLLYDGKSFNEWRSLWKSELKTEKRIECIKALAAFGRAGKGAEAAEAILDVAGQYDFALDGPSYVEDDAVVKLKESILEVLTNYGNHLPVSDWLPVLQLRLNKDSPSYRGFASQVLPRLVTSDKSAKPILLALQQSEDQAIRQAALSAIHSSQDIYTDDEKNELIQSVLKKEPVMAIRVLDQRLLDYVSVEQAVKFLLSEDIEVQLATRQALRFFFDEEKGQQLAEELLTVFNNPNRQQDFLPAVRALAMLRSHANAAEQTLTKLIESTDDDELIVAAAFAREMVTLKKNHSKSGFSNETKDAIRKSKHWPGDVDDDDQLNKAFQVEANLVTGKQSLGGGGGMGGMGGGGMGGGGMF